MQYYPLKKYSLSFVTTNINIILLQYFSYITFLYKKKITDTCKFKQYLLLRLFFIGPLNAQFHHRFFLYQNTHLINIKKLQANMKKNKARNQFLI